MTRAEMTRRSASRLFVVITLAAVTAVRGEAVEPAKAREPAAPVILVHVMPWYEAKPISPRWGWHWTMNAFDPEKRVGGRSELASHYRPLIGAYDSGDSDVLEYHTLLMKLAGIDGVIVDWYGREDHLDYALLHRNAGRLLRRVGKVKLRFAVCYEDQTIKRLVRDGRLADRDRVEHARKELRWLAKHWFRDPAYLRLDGRPLLLSFGQEGLTGDEWKQVLEGMPEPPVYLSEHQRRSGASGAFDWPVPARGLKAQDAFYDAARAWSVGVAVAFPRFHDIYEQARVHKSWGEIPDEGGRTFAATLERALKSGLPAVQIATWNDWGEGTAVEPSLEFGYRDLETVQRLRARWVDTRFSSTKEDLRLPLRLLRLRKQSQGRPEITKVLDSIAELLAEGSVAQARAALSQFERTR